MHSRTIIRRWRDAADGHAAVMDGKMPVVSTAQCRLRSVCAPASVGDERFHVVPIRKRGVDCAKALLDLLLLAVKHFVKLGVTLGVRNHFV